MEPAVRKLLPRVQPASASEQHTAAVPIEPIRNVTRSATHHGGNTQPVQWQPTLGEEQTGQKRKRQHSDDDHQHQPHLKAQSLPSLQHLLTAQHPTNATSVSPSSHARLIRASNDSYIHEGAFRFRSPPPQGDFPVTILEDPRPLSFAVVEPDLLDIFRRAWYLRQYIRLKHMRGENWLDHIFFNDCFGVENALYTWTSRYEPGMVQYPASKLYAHCLWLFFNRSVQASQPSPAYAQMVEDGLHHVRGIENALGASGDRSILLLPLFLLGVSAFYTEQRRVIWEALDRLDPSYSNESVNHAAKSLERIWVMMDEGHVMATWEWEKYHAYERVSAVRDRSLVDFLIDPLAPSPQPSRVRSPERQESDSARFRVAPSQQQSFYHSGSAPPPMQQQRLQRDVDGDTPPPRKDTPYRNHSITSVEASDDVKSHGRPESHSNHQSEIASVPKPFIAPLPPSQRTPQQQQQTQPDSQTPTLQSATNSTDSIHSLQRKQAKSKSSIPPCPACGKELKNPSDAQKHQLQHSKPFRCHEANCTRAQGFATENDLQRHRKSVHGASPRIGNKIGYVCAACPEPSDGTSRKWWPRLDNFKAHVRRKHQESDEEGLISLSASNNRPNDGSYADSGYYSSSTSTTLRWSDGQNGHSRQASAYEYLYAHSHSQSQSGEGGNHNATLRDSPEHEEDERGEEDDYHAHNHTGDVAQNEESDGGDSHQGGDAGQAEYDARNGSNRSKIGHEQVGSEKAAQSSSFEARKVEMLNGKVSVEDGERGTRLEIS